MEFIRLYRATPNFKPVKQSLVRAWFGRKWSTSNIKRHQPNRKRSFYHLYWCDFLSQQVWSDTSIIRYHRLVSTSKTRRSLFLSLTNNRPSTTIVGRTLIHNPRPLLCDVIVTFFQYRDLPPHNSEFWILIRHSGGCSTSGKDWPYVCSSTTGTLPFGEYPQHSRNSNQNNNLSQHSVSICIVYHARQGTRKRERKRNEGHSHIQSTQKAFQVFVDGCQNQAKDSPSKPIHMAIHCLSRWNSTVYLPRYPCLCAYLHKPKLSTPVSTFWFRIQ